MAAVKEAKRLLKRAINMLGYDLRQHDSKKRCGLIDFLHSRQVDLVFDVGANVGQFGVQLRSAGYSGDIVSFEPIPSVFAKLKHRIRGDRKWHAYNLALGDSAGQLNINISRNSVFSSIQSQTHMAQVFDPEAATTGIELIQVETLDAMAERHLFSRAFLKVDTQGYEQQVLKGSRRTFARIVGLQLELPIVHLYEGVWDFSSACDMMKSLGFVLSFIEPVNYDPVDPFALIEVDCVFRLTSTVGNIIADR
jgi:FkbM family methyltransferase